FLIESETQNDQEIFNGNPIRKLQITNQNNSLDAMTMQNIEENIEQILDMHQQLNQAIVEQGEKIIRIDENFEQGEENLLRTRDELKRYLERVVSDRCFVFKLLA
ncbi:MAG: Syntaxin-5, partial [Paramarteilia canceri]